jgi:hypothetical protein
MGVSQQLYVPVGVAPFSLIKPSAPADGPEDTDLFNGELQAIEAAFNQIFLLPVTSSNVILTPNSRNALIDLSPLINTGGYVKVTLPAHPSVGDPPCYVAVQAAGYETNGTSAESCVIVTTDDAAPPDEFTVTSQALINGMVPDNVGYTNQISMFNPGDIARFTYISPEQGWQVYVTSSVVVNPNGTWTQPAAGAFPWSGMEFHVASTANHTVLPLAVNQLGEWFIASKSKAGNLSIGDASYTFNTVPGPLVISLSNRRNRFFCQGGKVFLVQFT